MDIKTILVPVDYSECSQAALTAATTFAEKFGARLDVVHVWDRPLYVPENTMVHQGGARRSLIELIRDNAEQEMDAFVNSAKLPSTVAVTQRLLSGNPASKLLEELRQRKHDLAVIGTHGRTGLSHVLLGSVAEKLVRLSPVPVLTIPRPDGSP